MQLPETDVSRTRFRPSQSLSVIGILGLAFAALVAALSLYDQLVLDGQDSLLPALCIVTLMGTTGCYLIAHRHRAYIETNDHKLIQQGVFTRQSLSWSEVDSVDWKSPTSNVVLRGPTKSLSVDPVRDVDRVVSLSLIAQLKKHTQHTKHRGWNEYRYSYVAPLERHNVTRANLNQRTHIWETRGRVDRYMGWLSVLFFATGLLAAVILQQWRFAFGVVPVVGLWLVIRFSIPKAGQAQPRLKSSPEFRPLVRIAVLCLTGTITILIAKQQAAGPLVITAIALTYLGSMLWVAFQADRTRDRRLRENTEASIQA